MLRGIAALVVVVGHIRGFLIVDFNWLESGVLWHKLIYFIGGLGHQAVIAFFALSGYLVGGKALRDMQTGHWSLLDYLTARLARLWAVAIPALLLTLALDRLGSALGGAVGYEGQFALFLSSGPSEITPADHSIGTFFANVAFLQTILAPVYGSNGPLWSLANEFWYYIIFPLLASSVLVRSSAVRRSLVVAAALLIAWALPVKLVLLGSIWCAGALASLFAARRAHSSAFTILLYGLTASLCVAASVFAGFRWTGVTMDIVLGLAWAALLPALTMLPRVGGYYTCVANGLSEISYTLYATHFPLLAFIYFTFLAPSQWEPGALSIVLGLAMLALALALATLFWWLFERRTGEIRMAGLRLIRVLQQS